MSNASLTFYLNRETIYCQYYASDGRVQMSAGLKVDPSAKRTKAEKAYLNRITTVIDNYEANQRQAGYPTREADIRRLILEATGRKETKRGNHKTFTTYFDEYLKDIEAGNILNSGKRYSLSYIKIAGVVGRLLPDMDIGKIPVEAIREEDLREYGAQLTKLGYAKNSVATYFDPVLSFIQGGRRLGKHKGLPLDMRSFRVNREDVDHGVYLTEEEQQTILNIEYEGNEAMWRDAFILGCNLGMRHSDLSRLTPAHRSGNVVNINTTKTSTPVWVPLTSVARELWDKYNGVFNIPTLTPFMLFAKKLGEDAGLDKQILFSRTEGGVKVERWVPKYELMGTHTMRRSCATNLFKAKVPDPSIMKITGHKSYASFKKYIRLSDEEHATILLEHEYFK